MAANVNNPQENIGHWRAGTIRPLCVFSRTRLTYRAILAKVRETEEWKAWLRRGSQTDAFLSGPELDYIASDERWLRDQFAEDGWLVK